MTVVGVLLVVVLYKGSLRDGSEVSCKVEGGRFPDRLLAYSRQRYSGLALSRVAGCGKS